MDANLEAYKKFFAGHSGQKYAIEATPGYFYGGKETANAINIYSPESNWKAYRIFLRISIITQFNSISIIPISDCLSGANEKKFQSFIISI